MPVRQEVVSYPRDTTSSSNSSEQYSPAIIPTDLLHVRVGVSPPPGVILTIHGLPSQFWTAMAYIETLVTESFGCGTKSCGPRAERDKKFDQPTDLGATQIQPSLWSLDNIVITAPVLVHLLEIFCGYLWRTDVPAVIKEYLFHLFSQCIRILHYCEGSHGTSCVSQWVGPRLSPTQGIFQQLPVELKRLYEHVTLKCPVMPSSSGSQRPSEERRFSTYLQALFEANLAIFELFSIEKKPMPKEHPPSVAAEVPPSHVTSSSTTKKKKLKSKRERTESANRPSARPSSSESDTVVVASSTSSSGISTTSSDVVSSSSSGGAHAAPLSGRLEDMQWFNRPVTVSNILRYLWFGEKQGEKALREAIADAARLLLLPTAHTRLLVLTGIPKDMEVSKAKEVIWKVCNMHGRLDQEDIFLPSHTAAKMAGTPVKEKEELKLGGAGPDTLSSSSKGALVQNKSYAVINLPSFHKLDTVKKALYKCKPLLESYMLDSGEIADIPEEVLSLSTVNQSLLAGENNANHALEDYLHHLMHKKGDIPGTEEMSSKAVQALTDVFYSCYFLEQNQGSPEAQQESGYISLVREQILTSTPKNMLQTFINTVRPPKKPLADQVVYILRNYGITRSADKERAQPEGKEGHSPEEKGGKGKAKKSPRSSKEKLVLGQGEKSGSKERKVKSKGSQDKLSEDAKESEDVDSSTRAYSRGEVKCLTLDGFLHFVSDLAKQDVRTVWRALLACGFDFHFNRCMCVDESQAHDMGKQWTVEMDAALVTYINEYCRKMAIALCRIHPHEIFVSEADLVREEYVCLQGLPPESVRLRFAFLQSLNSTLETFFLPLVDLNKNNIFSRSTATLLDRMRNSFFYDTKVAILNRILNATSKRKTDQAAPEITLDPLESIGGEKKSSQDTVLCQAYKQLQNVNSQQLCVPLASGGDPTYAFNVRTLGEEVHGASGSFRHFLWQIARELQGSNLSLLIPCPNAASIFNKGRLLLKPGDMTFSEQQLLKFFGQLLGCTIRADIPLGLDLHSAFWKSLVGLALDPVVDLRNADSLTYSYMKRIEMVESEMELQALCADVFPSFVYSSITGEDAELINNGRNIPVSWSNRHEYIDAIKRLRLKELTSVSRVKAILSGLATLMPIQLLTLFSPADIEMRTCGLPHISIDFLKAHTMYQVGLMETDPHIQFFWTALESFSQEELCRFIKFACNQERVPQTCPCSSGGPDTAHVPPYPMKIAPPDGVGSPDERFIRVETCMFMIKLPQYSTLEKMTQQLKYVINCREDPLSG